MGEKIGGRTGVSAILSSCTKGGIKINYGNWFNTSLKRDPDGKNILKPTKASTEN